MLSVCMIVKNEAQNLTLTLPQLLKHGAEVIVVDTGSSDNTVEVAKELGAKVNHFSWINDFAAARNYSLSLATQPWILWLDADEYLKEEDVHKLIEILRNSPRDILAYRIILTESPFGKAQRGTSYSRVKIFRSSLGIHFERPINEQVVDKEGEVVAGEMSSLVIYHWGKHLSQEKMQEKKARYFNLYQKFLDKNPSDPYVNFLLGNLLREEGRAQEAYQAYEKTVASTKQDLRLKIDALNRIAEIALKLGMYGPAFKAARGVQALDPENMGAKNIIATLFIGIDQPDMAIRILENVLPASDFDPIDPAREQIIPRMILADAYAKKGDLEKADAWREEARRLEENINADSTK